jgi:DNA-binding transcriptional regulator GbsR (MarR family)
MKKIFLVLSMIILTGSVSFVQGKQEVRVNNSNQERSRTITINNEESVNVREIVQERVEERQNELKEEIEKMEGITKRVHEIQGQAKISVESLMEIKDFTNNVREEVLNITENFNNSINSTIGLEKRIESRNAFTRFFFGGDKDSAELIKREISENRERIKTLNQLKDDCDCEEDVREIISEQVENITQEQNRLEELANREKNNKWFMGRWFNWLKEAF